MSQLEQPTVGTPQQFQSAAGHRRASGLGENAGKRLLTEIEDGNQITAAADATSVDAMTHEDLAIVEFMKLFPRANPVFSLSSRHLTYGSNSRALYTELSVEALSTKITSKS